MTGPETPGQRAAREAARPAVTPATTPIAAIWLRAVVLDGLDIAISHEQAKYAFCPACTAAPDGTGKACRDHDRAQGLVAELQAAAVLVKMAGTDEELTAILHGGEPGSHDNDSGGTL